MRKNYFAKKFVAYSMAFAVAFSTLTVSPVFVKEAKAASSAVYPAASEFEAPAADGTGDQSDAYAGYTIFGKATTKLTPAGSPYAGDTKTDLGLKSNTQLAGKIDGSGIVLYKNTGSSTTANSAATVNQVPVVFNGKSRTTQDVNGNKDFTRTATGAVWFKLVGYETEVTYNVGTDTEKITVPYYTLEKQADDTLSFNEVNTDQLGMYIALDEVTDKNISIVQAINLFEDSDLEAVPSQKVVNTVIGKKVTLSVNASATRDLTYVWTKNGVELGTSSSLDVNVTTSKDFGTYSCKVSDGIDNKTITMTINESKTTTVSPAVKTNATTINTVENVLEFKDDASHKYTRNGDVTEIDHTTYLTKTDACPYEKVYVNVLDEANVKTTATLVTESQKRPDCKYTQVYATNAGDKSTYAVTPAGNKALYSNGVTPATYLLENAGTLDGYKKLYTPSYASSTFKLNTDELTLSSSIPKSDNLVYVWYKGLKGAGAGASIKDLMTDAQIMEYNTDERTVSIDKNKVGNVNGSQVITVCAYDKDEYLNEATIKPALTNISKATTYNKLTYIGALMNAEAALADTAIAPVYKEVITLQSEELKDKSEVKVVGIGDTLKLTAPAGAVNYQWTKPSTSQITKLDSQDLVVNTMGINDFGTYTCAVTTQNGVYNYKVNVVYVSDIDASADSLVSAKVGQKDVAFKVNATSTLPVSCQWTVVSGAATGTVKYDDDSVYTLPEITSANKANIFNKLKTDGTLNVESKAYKCVVSDGISSKTLYMGVKESVGFTVEAIDTLYARENTKVTLAPTVKLDQSKEVTYSWTKTGSSKELSTAEKFEFDFDGVAAAKYTVTITDGTQIEKVNYVVSKLTAANIAPKLNNVERFNVTTKNVKYNGSAQDGDLQVLFTLDGSTFVLVKDSDYRVTYENNVNAGDARYTVSFIGDFADYKDTDTKDLALVDRTPSNKTTIEGRFSIDKADNEVTVADKTIVLGESVQPKTTNKAGAPVTYTYYADAECTTEIDVPSKVGTYYVKANAIATVNYNEATSNVATVKVVPGKVKMLGTSRTASSVKLNWTKATGATSYRVYYKAQGAKSYKVFKNTTANSMNVTGLASATTYTFAVKAYAKTAGYSTVYATKQTTTAPAKVATPSVTAGSKKATVKFTKVARATGYQIYMAKGNGKYVKVKTTTSTSFTKTGLAKGATYKFKVRAYKTVGSNTYYGAFSSAKAVKVK